jgi:hypothetical protein
MSKKIILIRHGEKPDEAKGILGVSSAGREDRREPSIRGWQRAAALLRLFGGWAGGVPPALAHPDKIYACRPDRKSARPLRTVELLAETLSLEVDTRFGNDEEAALAAEADQAEGTVLICWKHEALPRLAERLLGNASELPAEWPADRFDMTWIFDRKPSAAGWIFSQVPQLLFPGDSVEPFPSRSQ